MAWDVFGNGKTAVKVNAGKYEDPASNLNNNYSISNPIARIATTAARTWTDNGANGGIANDNVPQCNFTNQAANGECLGMNNPTFGTATPITAAIDPNLLNGWGIRPNDWQIGASVQQQLMPRVSVEVGYFRRWLGNFTATDNTSLSAADFTAFALTAPSDPRLPGGGGYAVNDLNNITAAGFARPATNNITDAANFGTEYSALQRDAAQHLGAAEQRPDVPGRRQHAARRSRTTARSRRKLPELTIAAVGNGVAPLVGPTNPYCHTDPGFITKLTRHRLLHLPEGRRPRSPAPSAATRARRCAPRGTRRLATVIAGAGPPGGRRPARRSRSTSSRPASCGAIASTSSTSGSGRS